MQLAYDDATIACDGKLYPVHRFILSISSPYFSQMFSATRGSGRHPIIVLKDIPHDIFEIILKYIYLGEVNIEKEKFGVLINAAQCLQINGLSSTNSDDDSIIKQILSTPASAEGCRLSRKRGRPRKNLYGSVSPADISITEGITSKKVKSDSPSDLRCESPLHDLSSVAEELDPTKTSPNKHINNFFEVEKETLEKTTTAHISDDNNSTPKNVSSSYVSIF